MNFSSDLMINVVYTRLKKKVNLSTGDLNMLPKLTDRKPWLSNMITPLDRNIKTLR